MTRVTYAVFLLAASPAMAQEPANCTPIKFARGASSATVTGMVGSDEPFPCYTLVTGSGQTATLKFRKTNGNMAFTIDDVASDRDAYTFKTAAKTYRFFVIQNMQAPPAPYALMVTVK